jgi:membrane-associated phospholipid phosphatase
VHRLWVLVTDCGDAAVTLPLAVLVLVVRLVARARPLARRWLVMVVGSAAAVGALKLLFGVCESRLGGLDIVSPSGHTAMSTAIYGSLALLVGAGLSAGRRRAVLAAAALLITGIAVSRVVLHNHATSEILVGLAVGLVAAVWFGSGLRRQAAIGRPFWWLGAAGLAIVLVMHGTRADIEPHMHDWALDLRLVFPWCR